MAEHYDLVVIGSGPAGEKGAAQAAYFGKRVAMVERSSELGGASINTGTIPSKTLRETALYFSGLRHRGLYGIDYSLKEDLSIRQFMRREHEVVKRERGLIRQNLDRHGIAVMHGAASLVDAHTVRVTTGEGGTLDLMTEVILIATGSSPRYPANVPPDKKRIFDSDSILELQRLPQSMIVLGSGVIGCEYAALFAALDVEVTLLATGERLLPFVDAEIVERLRMHLELLGMRFLFNHRVASIEHYGSTVELQFDQGGSVTGEIVLIATGRRSNVEGLYLEQLGVQCDSNQTILVNQHYQTTVSNIYAAGDVIGFPALASTSMEQARVAMVHAFDLQYKETISPIIPLAIYTIPEIALVGLTEEACQEQQLPYLVGSSLYEANARGAIIGDHAGMVKLLFSPLNKQLLGVHIIGELASELIHLGAQSMADGRTIDTFIEAVYNYPTLSELYKYAAYDGLGNLQAWQTAHNDAKQC
ncbi:MAG: Si-specific NAD(P)(+) transhydrogenase [Dehalococcoidia bacterium]